VFNYLSKEKKLGHSETSLEARHFSKNPEMFNSLCNIYLNNCEKFSLSTLKAVGYKSEYMDQELIMMRFIIVINSVLTKDTDRICCGNQKMMDRLFLWSLFWSIGSSLPERCIERLEKIFDLIKI
jgi:hypothetical protein